MKKTLLLFIAALAVAGAVYARPQRDSGATSGAKKTIACFIPGVRAGSAVYDMLATGVERAVRDYQAESGAGVTLNIVEAGYNQAEWEEKVLLLALSGRYDVIISSNPSLPAIAASVLEKQPNQKFILLDGQMNGAPTVYSLQYNQSEQGFLAGTIAALVSSELGASGKVGLVAAQEYPVMNNIILPAYAKGAKAVNAQFDVEFRVIGNWFDAGKAGDLTREMYRTGSRVFLAIAGGANEGVLQAASELGAKVVWFDANGYAQKEGTVVGSAVLNQEKASYEKTLLYLRGALPFGTHESAGMKDGFVDFIEDDPIYTRTVSAAVREKQAAFVKKIRTGELVLK